MGLEYKVLTIAGISEGRESSGVFVRVVVIDRRWERSTEVLEDGGGAIALGERDGDRRVDCRAQCHSFTVL